MDTEGPVITGVRHPLLKETFFGKNSKSLPDPLHPLLKSELENFEKKVQSGELTGHELDMRRAGVAGEHSEIYALNQALFALEKVSGRTLTKESLGEFLLYNRSLSKEGGVPPRCFNCKHITDGVQVIGND